MQSYRSEPYATHPEEEYDNEYGAGEHEEYPYQPGYYEPYGPTTGRKNTDKNHERTPAIRIKPDPEDTSSKGRKGIYKKASPIKVHCYTVRITEIYILTLMDTLKETTSYSKRGRSGLSDMARYATEEQQDASSKVSTQDLTARSAPLPEWPMVRPNFSNIRVVEQEKPLGHSQESYSALRSREARDGSRGLRERVWMESERKNPTPKRPLGDTHSMQEPSLQTIPEP